MKKNSQLHQLIAAIWDNNYAYLGKAFEHYDCECYRDSTFEDSLLHAGHHVGMSMMYFLLQHGVNPNEQDVSGNTVLHYAASENNVCEIEMLLKFGAIIDIPNVHGEDAFSFACVWDSLEAAKLLFDNGSKMIWVKKNWTKDILLKSIRTTPRIKNFLLDLKILP